MYTVEKSKDNLNILKIKINNKEKYLGSYYNHKRDIDKFIQDIGMIKNKTAIVIYGLLDGEYLLRLSEIKKKDFKIIVFEDNEELMQNIAQDNYYRNLINDERIRVFKYDEKNIEIIFKNELELSNIYNVKFVENKVLYDYKKK